MSEFEQIVIGKSSVPALLLSVIFLIAIPAFCFIFWRSRHKEQTKLSYLIAGALGFIVSARILELGVHYFCIIQDNPVSRFIHGSTAAFVLYGTLMAGVFEECGRYIILRYIMKRNQTRENAVLYGIGHGGIEILTVVLPAMATYLAIVVLFSGGQTENALRILNITEETAAAALPVVQAAASFEYGMMLMNVLERLFSMFVHIGLSVIVYYGVRKEKKIYLLAAILLHMLVDTFPALYQRGLLSLWMTEGWLAVWTVLILLPAGRLYRKMEDGNQAEKA